MKKVILDLCGGTGAWSKPYKEAGFDVQLVTLPKYNVLTAQFGSQEVWFPENNEFALKIEIESVYGILAAPPCTEFSKAKLFHGKGNYTHDFALELVIACLKIIAMIQPKWWALESPNGYLKRWMGEPQAIFEPWHYGDTYQKTTLLWGKFNMPEAIIKEKPSGMKKFSMLHSNEIAPEYHGIYDRTVRRSITPARFAQAFFKANSDY
jgi:site-specific DNA-cytosine methylase